jgi:hypothetical protein
MDKMLADDAARGGAPAVEARRRAAGLAAAVKVEHEERPNPYPRLLGVGDAGSGEAPPPSSSPELRTPPARRRKKAAGHHRPKQPTVWERLRATDSVGQAYHDAGGSARKRYGPDGVRRVGKSPVRKPPSVGPARPAAVPVEIAHVVEQTARFVARHGVEFETKVKMKRRFDERFQFLFQACVATSEQFPQHFHAAEYYHQRLLFEASQLSASSKLGRPRRRRRKEANKSKEEAEAEEEELGLQDVWRRAATDANTDPSQHIQVCLGSQSHVLFLLVAGRPGTRCAARGVDVCARSCC